jgi:ribosome biogenesis protein Nip4
MKAFEEYVRQFCDLSLDVSWIGKEAYLAEPMLHDFVRSYAGPIESAGLYLGRIRGSRFVPSLALIDILSRHTEKKVFVNTKTAWLFLCGRDVFRTGIKRFNPPMKKGDLVFVQNLHDENLGLGKVQGSLTFGSEIAVKNVMDKGDYLRREMD